VLLISDDDGHLHSIKKEKVVIQFNDGKNLEVGEDYAKKGLLLWGGREPFSGLLLE
jgi:hypothetical protein